MQCISITALVGRMGAARLQGLFADEPRRAAQWVRALAADGLCQAQICYGRMLLEGQGVEQDKSAALAWFRRAAAGGDADAINMVGRCLDNGWGTPEDAPAAAEHFQRAASAGHAWAQYNLGHMYLDGRGVVRDRGAAFACYSQAAQQRHERAMNLLGRCCEEGWGTPRDLRAAADWYRRSAEGGYFRGQFNWGTLLLKARRFNEAARCFEQAANSGTAAVRAAVLSLINRAGAPEALRQLALRLQAT
jgi:uncharacterized protein